MYCGGLDPPECTHKGLLGAGSPRILCSVSPSSYTPRPACSAQVCAPGSKAETRSLTCSWGSCSHPHRTGRQSAPVENLVETLRLWAPDMRLGAHLRRGAASPSEPGPGVMDGICAVWQAAAEQRQCSRNISSSSVLLQC